MFSWMKKEGEKPESIDNVVEGLKKIYRQKLLPLEEYYQFHDFHSPKLEDPDFDAKPMILLVGQYSTGKTTFIKYLLERDFPGIRIGPEPTTDRFIAVMYDEKEGVVPGNALVVDPKKQFRPLSKFGNAFLNRFQCSTVASPVLKGISIVDTPGILSGEKQRVDRGYDFTGVLEWFAERVDRIILLFDAHKLDISDEFRRSIEALRGHDDKIRIVLNKADMIDHQQLMRVYGALMWSLGKVLQTPEVARVYIGSFWDQPLRYDVNRRLFEDEEQDLFRDMQSLPRNAALRKLNDLIKRARLAKVHAYIVSELQKDMPSMFGKEGKKKELIKNLGQIYDKIRKEHQISPGDFPDIKKMQESLQHHDFTKFHPLRMKFLAVVDDMLAVDIARLMDMIPHEEMNIVADPVIRGRYSIEVLPTVPTPSRPFPAENRQSIKTFPKREPYPRLQAKFSKSQSKTSDDIEDGIPIPYPRRARPNAEKNESKSSRLSSNIVDNESIDNKSKTQLFPQRSRTKTISISKEESKLRLNAVETNQYSIRMVPKPDVTISVANILEEKSSPDLQPETSDQTKTKIVSQHCETRLSKRLLKKEKEFRVNTTDSNQDSITYYVPNSNLKYDEIIAEDPVSTVDKECNQDQNKIKLGLQPSNNELTANLLLLKDERQLKTVEINQNRITYVLHPVSGESEYQIFEDELSELQVDSVDTKSNQGELRMKPVPQVAKILRVVSEISAHHNESVEQVIHSDADPLYMTHISLTAVMVQNSVDSSNMQSMDSRISEVGGTNDIFIDIASTSGLEETEPMRVPLNNHIALRSSSLHQKTLTLPSNLKIHDTTDDAIVNNYANSILSQNINRLVNLQDGKKPGITTLLARRSSSFLRLFKKRPPGF